MLGPLCLCVHRTSAEVEQFFAKRDGGRGGWRGEGEEDEGGAGHAEGDEAQELHRSEEDGRQREGRG